MEELVTFEQAKKLKALGYDQEVERFYYFNGELAARVTTMPCNFNMFNDAPHMCFYSAPSLQHARKWLTEGGRILDIMVEPLPVTPTMWHYIIRIARKKLFRDNFSSQAYKEYNDALSAAIDAALNVLQTKNTDL